MLIDCLNNDTSSVCMAFVNTSPVTLCEYNPEIVQPISSSHVRENVRFFSRESASALCIML